MSGYRSLHATREDDGEGIVYRLPLLADEARIIAEGRGNLFLKLRRSPPSLVVAVLPIGRRFLASDELVRQVPLLIGPEAAL